MKQATIITQELLSKLEATNEELFLLLSSFRQDEINKTPGKDSWTAARVADHLVKSDKLIIKSLYGPSMSTERNPAQNVEPLKSAFLNFNIKMSSPNLIIPENKTHEKKVLINTLASTREQLTKAAKTLDAEDTCLHIDEPALAGYTRLELIHFVLYHTQRHIHQLKNIYREINKRPE